MPRRCVRLPAHLAALAATGDADRRPSGAHSVGELRGDRRARRRVVRRLADNGVLAIGDVPSRVLDQIRVDEIGGAVTLGLAHYSTMAEVDHLLRTLASLG